MPRYYFHLHNAIEATDEEGTVLPDLDAAKAHAIECARELMSDEIRRGRINLNHWIGIEDEQGAQLLAVRFGDCVEISG